MKTSLLFFITLFFSCSKAGIKPPEEKITTEKSDTVTFHANWIEQDTMSIYHYMDSIAYYIHDSVRVKELAKKDADKNVYFFMMFGMRIQHLNPDPSLFLEQRAICLEHHILIFDMGCENSVTGSIYTREMKKFLKQNKGLDFDSIFNPILVNL